MYEQAPAIPHMKNLRDHVIKCVEREGREAESGSDGEEIHDLPIRPVFDKVELGVVRHMFAGLFDANECAKGVGFYNAVGKRFVRALGDYANLSVTTDATALPTHFFFLESTSKGPPQPGALYLTWKLPKELRSSERFVWAKRERYAD